MSSYQQPDARGHFGPYGGRFVAEALMAVIEEVTAAYEKARTDHSFLAELDSIVLVGSQPPVGFFAYPGKPSKQYPPQAQLHVLARVEQDGEAALRALADELGAPEVAAPDAGPRPQAVTGTPTPEGLAQTLAAVMPEQAIIVDESVSYGRGFYPHTFAAPAHDWLHLVGGAIGAGLPMATGAAIAAGSRGRTPSMAPTTAPVKPRPSALIVVVETAKTEFAIWRCCG